MKQAATHVLAAVFLVVFLSLAVFAAAPALGHEFNIEIEGVTIGG